MNRNIKKKSLKKRVNFDLITYNDVNILTNYVSDQGKILSRRVTGLSWKQQKKVTKLIKTARIAAGLI